ncbi:MAG: hypothetical protein GF401_16485 [Chitinivibrionales bacterium]|nr:hypothetical protein [Chitinivibrionales bacterium]
MEIDIVTIVAQIINFLILAAVLYFVLFRRIVKAMKTREEKINQQIDESRRKNQEAEKLKQEYETKMKEFEKKQSDLLTSAKEDASKKGEEMTQKAREEAERQKKQWIQDFQSEWEQSLDQVTGQAREMLFELSAKMVTALGGEDMQKGVMHAFVNRMTQSKDTTVKEFLESADGPINIVSSHPLSKKEKSEIEEAIRAITENKPSLSFTTDEHIKLGIEIRSDGKKIGWSIDEYIREFQEHLSGSVSRTGGNENINEETENDTTIASHDRT